MYRVLAYLKYFLYCVNEHSLHSPLVYDLYRNVIKKGGKSIDDPEIEALRKAFLSSEEIIEVNDLGAGQNRSSQRRVKEIASKALSSAHKSKLLCGMAEFFESKKIVELGCSLGLNSLYLSRYVPQAEIVTFEGDKKIADIASENFRKLGAENIELTKGNLDNTLSNYMSKISSVDLVYMDANHRYKPTLEYYNEIIRRCHDDSVIIIDDIHYSKEMDNAWKELSQKVEITLSIDLFNFGILKMDPRMRKKHYILGF